MIKKLPTKFSPSELGREGALFKKAQKDICEVCGVHPAMLFSRGRSETICIARFFLYSILRSSGYTWTKVGELTGRDHGAVFHGVRRLEQRLACREKHLVRLKEEIIERGWVINPLFDFEEDNKK